MRNPESAAALPRDDRSLQQVLSVALLVAAAWQLVHMFGAMWHLRATAIFADQWHIFRTYLDLPFPENVFVNQNSHLLLFPSLVFLTDIYFFDAQQWFPFLFGMGLCVVAVATMAYLARTDEVLPLLTRSASLATFVFLLFWAGGSRTLLHSNEIVCIFFVVSSVLMTWAVLIRAGDPTNPRPESERSAVIAAGILCLVATYSFGTGLAGFPAALLVATMLRVSPINLAILAAFFAFGLFSYVATLPAPASMPAGIELDPVLLLQQWAIWVGTPVTYLLRGETWEMLTNDPDIQKIRDVQTATIGAIGLLVAAALTAWSLWRPPRTRLAYLAFGLIAFSAASGFIVAFGRFALFLIAPMQLMADRYLVWSTLFWSGISLLALVGLAGLSRFKLVAMGASVALSSSLAYGAIRSEDNWLQSVGDMMARSRTCRLYAQLRIHHPSILTSCRYITLGKPSDSFFETLQTVQARKLSGLSETWDDVLGRNVFQLFPRAKKGSLNGRMELVRVFQDEISGRQVARIKGWSADEESGSVPELILLADPQNRIVGIAQPESIDIAEARRRGWPPLTRFRFTGFVMDYKARERYSVVAVEGTQGKVLGKLARSSGTVASHDAANQ